MSFPCLNPSQIDVYLIVSAAFVEIIVVKSWAKYITVSLPALPSHGGKHIAGVFERVIVAVKYLSSKVRPNKPSYFSAPR